MSKDNYASEEDTRALLRKDTRTPAERKLDRMLEDRGASEQGAEPFLILRQIALELLAEQPAQRTWVGLTDEEVLQIRENLQAMEGISLLDSLTKAIEAKLKEKNNG